VRRKRPKVLIISEASDLHVPPIADAIRRAGATSNVLDLARLPREVSLAVGHDSDGRWRARLTNSDGSALSPRDPTAVWWRRPRTYGLGSDVTREHQSFAIAQLHEAMIGVWSALDAEWVNEPWSDQRASHKLRQLALAHELGFELPRTIVTTSATEMRSFVAGREEEAFVLKTLAPSARYCPPTRRATKDAFEDAVTRLASPVVVQERMPGVDVRVTCVRGELFATEIDARRTSSPDDFRPVYGACRVAPTTLSGHDAKLVREFLRRMALTYAAFDFRRTECGRLVFLEANPAGQWLFIEERTGQPISEALAACLCSGGDGAALGGRAEHRRDVPPGVAA
jgi:hypothetical protein